MKTDKYLEINRKHWNRITKLNLVSEFYDNDSFINGRNTLNAIELPLLGDLKGKSLLHLQCHFGQDTLSMARMGAMVTGVDLSDIAINTARELADKIGVEARFICDDVYSINDSLKEEFDLIFCSYGTIGWLPDIDKWAAVVSKHLKKGGRLVFAEFHPMMWMFDDNYENFIYKYGNDEPIIEDVTGSYADKEDESVTKIISWNHGLAEVTNALIKNGLQIQDFQEYDYSPYDIFNGHGTAVEKGKYRIEKFEHKMPLVYSLIAKK